MRRVLTGLVVVVGLLCWTSHARAIVIEYNGSRIGGFFQSNDGKTLTILVRNKDGQEEESRYLLAKVKIISEVDLPTLEKLSPDQPAAYRDYAKKLAAMAAMENDPEARYVARHLYLIAAHLDPKTLGPACLLAMSDLAETPAEARRCRAMAYVLDSKSDETILKADDGKSEKQPKLEASALRDFLKPLQLYRKGNVREAAVAAKGTAVEAVFAAAPGKLSQKNFMGWCSDANCATCKTKGKVLCSACSGRGVVVGEFGAERGATCNGLGSVSCTTCDGTGIDFRPSDEVMRTVLRAELWAIAQLSGDDSANKAPRESGWSSALKSRQVKPVTPLTLETITEFDPRKCYYRGRVWKTQP